jgi:phosphate uptake regulator
MGGGIKGYDKLLEKITRRMSLDHGEATVIRSLKQIIGHLEEISEYARQIDEEEAGCKSNEGSY